MSWEGVPSDDQNGIWITGSDGQPVRAHVVTNSSTGFAMDLDGGSKWWRSWHRDWLGTVIDLTIDRYQDQDGAFDEITLNIGRLWLTFQRRPRSGFAHANISCWWDRE